MNEETVLVGIVVLALWFGWQQQATVEGSVTPPETEIQMQRRAARLGVWNESV